MKYQIIDLHEEDTARVEQIAWFLYSCFQTNAPAWLPDLESSRREVAKSFQPEKRSRVLIDKDGMALAWVGAITDENLWEIHPIAVAPDQQGNGMGMALVSDIVELAKNSGAVAVWAGTSDETGVTSFSKIDLYKYPASALENISAPRDHPVSFWSKTGFSLVGVLPDEEGLGKPGIHFAMRLPT
jgi:aminoglycoside 6'-N-acetyltransferase I